MQSADFEENTAVLFSELEWLAKTIRQRRNGYDTGMLPLGRGEAYLLDMDLPENDKLSPPADISTRSGPYAELVNAFHLDAFSRLLLILALSNEVAPGLLAMGFAEGNRSDSRSDDFGRVRGINFSGFLPSGLTFLFLAGGRGLADRIRAKNYLQPESALIRARILLVEPNYKGEPTLSGKLSVTAEWADFLILGRGEISFATAEGIPNISNYPGETIKA